MSPERRALMGLIGWRILFNGNGAELFFMAAQINLEEISLRTRQNLLSINNSIGGSG
jgi:hypothetical protein